MILFLAIIFFILGFVLIFYSADTFIDNIRDIIKVRYISPFLLGAILLGVDLEEIIASIMASFLGYPTVAVGNVIGNTIIALTLPFAIPAMNKAYNVKNPPRIFLITLFLLILLYFCTFFLSLITSTVFLISGFVSIAFYVILLCWNVMGVKKIIQKRGQEDLEEELEGRVELDDDEDQDDEDDDNASSKIELRKKIMIIIGSALLIALGGYFLGEGLEGIIEGVGISQHIMGYVIVAFGTNIEEFTLILKSVKKKVPEVATGAIIMKCAWNMGVTYGISMLINWDVPILPSLIVNLIILALTIGLFVIFIQRNRIGKKIGTGFLLVFIVYLFFNFAVLSN
ncbi:MAG: sodium:calcium antiporter [Candidatus Hodarchaeota archaeon]